LKLTYNKAHQAAITNEILEIVGGVEAFERIKILFKLYLESRNCGTFFMLK
jgi:hypothetical protein